MNNRKRSKYEKSECVSLPLEKTDLLIENIHNLKNSLNLYRKEIQEKNKHIVDVKADLNFYECLLTNINIVWNIFNKDLLTLIGDYKKLEHFRNNSEKAALIDNPHDAEGGRDDSVSNKSHDGKEENNSSQCNWNCEIGNNEPMSPYYDIEIFQKLFLKYVNKHNQENDEEEEADFFRSMFEDDICGGKNIKVNGREKKNRMEEGDFSNGKKLVKKERKDYNQDEKHTYYNNNRNDYDCDNGQAENCERSSKKGEGRIHYVTEKIEHHKGKKIKNIILSENEKKERNKKQGNELLLSNVIKIKQEDNKFRKMVGHEKTAENGVEDEKRIHLSSHEKINLGSEIGTVSNFFSPTRDEVTVPANLPLKGEMSQNGGDPSGCLSTLREADVAANEATNETSHQREGRVTNLQPHGFSTNAKVKKERSEYREGLDDPVFDKRNIFEQKLQMTFLGNIKRTISFINKLMEMKTVVVNHNIEYIRKINYEKNIYYEKYIMEKKKKNDVQNKFDELKIELDRTEKKIASLLFKLNNENICKNILNKDDDDDEPDTMNKNTLNEIVKTDELLQNEVNKITCTNCGFQNNNVGDVISKDQKRSENCSSIIKNEKNISGEWRRRGSENEEMMNSSYNSSSSNEKKNSQESLTYVMNFEKIITKEKILKSEPFKQLIDESTQIYKELKERENEISLLKKEIMKMENLRDEEYENLLNETMNDKNCLINKIKNLQIDIMTCKMDKEKMQGKINIMEYEINILKGIEKNQTMQLDQKEKEISRMKALVEKLKLSENNLMNKIQSMEIEGQVSDITEVGSHVVHEEEGRKLPNGKCEPVLESGKGRHTTGSGLKHGAENGPTMDSYKELLTENKQLKHALEKKKNVEKELENLKKNYDDMSEEIEEITKEFEKKQEQVDEMIIQIKNKELESLEKYNNMINKAYVEENLKQLELSYEEKISSISRIYEKYENFVNLYLTLFYYARKSAVISDSAREEQMSIFIKLKEKYESIFQKKNEIAQILHEVYGSNKKLIDKCNLLYRENQHLEKTIISSQGKKESKNVSSKTKEEKKDENNDEEDNHLLIEENNELRRRLICSVCMENFRNYIIVKCGHIYCENCIFSNLKTRNRKCPQCKIPFDKKDLQKIFLD
ncbi:trophozoite exported protein 1 [Plasmodium gonderi]|uniref:E3 ubiquitin protein ligase n=1 Tax=Plasmodium gonderi TaxID=77519 RepID=A0A1Y1JHI6_PLAGO|nr:trophozoite exported protein 1 [Plasmodium gonderi]GAW81986.1 trophozoite exported protein 1 [Plasmodium gonderi]